MKPFSRLTGLAGESLNSIATALSEVPGSLSHGSQRIAVTGLQRAGKTVFVTSLAHALLNAANAPKEDFPFFPWRGELQDVTLEEIPSVPPFPYRERLEDLLADSPKWPKRTTGLTGLRIRIRHTPTSAIARRIISSTTLDLDLIDYPGEWLLDLPMLSQSFQDWSARMEKLADVGGRTTLSGPWLEGVKALDPDGKENSAELARIGALYVDYIKRCRFEQNLYYVQPGRFLVDESDKSSEASIFFPLSRSARVKPGSNAAALIKRYRAYQRLVRRFYGTVFGRLRRQVVLVDLLTALQNGHNSFADLALAMRTISEAFEDLKSPLRRLTPFGRVDRLALVATKADHITADQMANLVNLLRDMIGEPFMQMNARQSGLLAVAAVRATTQTMRRWQDQSLPFLRGMPEGRDIDAIEVNPGVIPGQIPDAAQWNGFEFNIRPFAPPKLTSPYNRPLPHINLDKVLQFLIA